MAAAVTELRGPGHGSRARYNRGCRCRYCRVANADYVTRRRAARDRRSLVDAVRAREHLHRLVTAGLGVKEAAVRAEVARRTLRLIRSGERARIRADLEKKILAVRVPRLEASAASGR